MACVSSACLAGQLRPSGTRALRQDLYASRVSSSPPSPETPSRCLSSNAANWRHTPLPEVKRASVTCGKPAALHLLAPMLIREPSTSSQTPEHRRRSQGVISPHLLWSLGRYSWPPCNVSCCCSTPLGMSQEEPLQPLNDQPALFSTSIASSRPPQTKGTASEALRFPTSATTMPRT